MPKEKIYDKAELFDIEIGWARERDVQIGISTHDGRSLADWLAGRGLPPANESQLPPLGDTVDAAQRAQVFGDSAVEENDRHGYSQVTQLPQFTSLWTSLDRAGINRLIKMLRRARDEAYGRDE